MPSEDDSRPYPEAWAADIGAPDVSTMGRIRELYRREEPLVERAQFDSVLDPQRVQVQFADGIGDATWCRLDVTWYTTGAYSFHYTDEQDVNWRFDNHPNTHSPDAHFHRPPEATTDETATSCIQVTEPRLVARAVLKLWRRAYEKSDFSLLNTASNPP